MEKPKILIIAGDYWHAAGALEHPVRNTCADEDWTFESVIDPTEVPWDSLKDYRVIVLAKSGAVPSYAPDGSLWLSEDQEALIARYVQEGGSLLALHCGLCEYRKGGPVRKLMRGHFLTHPPMCEVRLDTVGQHDVLESVLPTIRVTDEQYHVDTDESQTTVFLKSSAAGEPDHVAGWTHDAGKGLVICLAPGHFRSVLDHPSMFRLLRNCMRKLVNRKA